MVKSLTIALAATLLTSAAAASVSYAGFTFESDAAFADTVVTYAPGAGVQPPHDNPAAALGAPQLQGGGFPNDVSLGIDGSLVLAFDSPFLTDGPGDDFVVFEVGSASEPMIVEISTDGVAWTLVGQTPAGGAQPLDLNGIGQPGDTFPFVRLTNASTLTGSPYAGADVDAVGLLNTGTTPVVPEPAGTALFAGMAVLLAAARRNRR